MSNASGNFVYYYVLNGMVGTYTVTATDGVNSASTTFTETRYRLQGYTRLPQAKWTDGILKGWFECDEVPYRLKMIEVEATTYILSNYHDNELDNVTGIDYCTDFYVGYENESVAPSTEVTFNVTGPFYQTPVKIKEIYYTWNVTYTSNATGKTYYLYWKAHLASGSSNWPGAKLHAKTDATGAQDVPIAVPPALLGEISGYKFNDLDRNGTWDLNETGLPGWTINLSMWDETTSQWVFLASNTTDTDGYYEFTSLVYGDYKVTEEVKDGWINTTNTEIFPITLNKTDYISENNNFGNHALAPPVACFTVSNDSPNVCETVTFNASCSYDPDGVIVKYEWDWEGDCTYDFDAGNNPIATHHYDMHGTYSPKLRVTDNDGLTNETQTTILVRAHPVARFTWAPEKPQVCETVTFDASASTPDGGVIISWDWNFGDNSTGSGEILTHHYDNYGNYTVTLNVTDSEGKWDTESKVITVRAHPHADFTWSPFSPQVCENVTFDASASTPDGGTIISYEWDFGDGEKGTGKIVIHHYSDWGNFTVTLNITDSEGKWDTETKIITVREHPQADFTWSPLSPQVNEDVTFDASPSTPNGGTIISYDWDFDDGYTDSGKIVVHQFSNWGTFTVTLNVTDSEGKWDVVSKNITVRAHPHADFTWSPTDPQVCETVTFDGSPSTPNGGTIVSYEWDFGDGNSDSGKIVTHHYSAPGDYTVTLNVTDSEGKWDTESKVITVRAHPHADFTWSPPYPEACHDVTFDASASTPNGGYIVSYEWDFGDGSPHKFGKIVIHKYDKAGTYKVTLTVTDSEDKSDTVQKYVGVKGVCVGGYALPIDIDKNTSHLLAPQIGLTFALLAAVSVTILLTKRRSKTVKRQH